MAVTMISYERQQIISSTPTCPYGHHSSLKTHAVRPTYSREAAVGTAVQPNTASAGAQLPLKAYFLSSTPNLERSTLVDPCLRRGKYACADGAKAAPSAASKVITDVTAQVMATHVTHKYSGTQPDIPR